MDDRIYYKTDLEKVECVNCGVYRGRHWIISSVAGDHPCAYIESKNDYSNGEKDFAAHGGINFCGGVAHIQNVPRAFRNLKYNGWDYAHYDDFEFRTGWGEQQYTVEEIVNEIEMVIDGIVNYEAVLSMKGMA